ncbi:MAG: protein translocase subunit SecD [Deltaproteobacteria bacterium]|nr:protein translocase subunit SecD [Deltaproteobacteria bacterium]
MIHNILQYGVAGVALLCLVGGWLVRARRGALWWAGAAAAVAAISEHYRVFWPTAVFGLMVLWALFAALPWLTNAWRLKTGLALFLALVGGFSLYPTLHDEVLCSAKRGGALRASCPQVIAALGPEERTRVEEEAKRGELGFGRYLLANIPFRMVRGLDLKGGLRLVYTVDVDEAIKDKRDRYYDDLRAALTRAFGFAKAEEQPTVAQMQKLAGKLELRKPRAQADTIVATFAPGCKAENKDGKACPDVIDEEFMRPFQWEMTLRRSVDRREGVFRVRNEVASQIRERAVGQARQTIQRRIDGLGLKDAALSVRDEDVIVEIPGENERMFQEIRDIISQTARLEFKMLDDDVDFFEKLATQTAGTDLPKGLSFAIENAPVGPGMTKPNHFGRLMRLEGEDIESALKRFKKWAGELDVGQDHEIGFGKIIEFDEKTEKFVEAGWRTYYLWGKAEITGDLVRDAQAVPDQSDRGLGGWHVLMDMTALGGEIFERITGANVKRRFAIILDGKVESAPVIQTKIGGGRAQITMGAGSIQQQLEDSRKLELVLRSGALPAPISPSNEQRIGASLGDDSIRQGLLAAGVGGLLVIAIMLLWYRRAGLIATFGVLFNLGLQLAVMSMFSASMTLPGICGLALTIGMAVDANVLINERIKEELREGKPARSAVAIGYEKAFTAILDGNLTTLIVALVLAQYGTGPIKGFAITLFIGVLANLYTGVTATRLLFEFWVRGRRDIKLSIGAV